MKVLPKAVTRGLSRALGILTSACLAAHSASELRAQAPGQGTAPEEAWAPGQVHVRWLAELGSESFVVAPAEGTSLSPTLVVSVPGAAYLFDRDASGGLRKRRRLAADSAAPYGVASTRDAVALADRLGAVSLWATSAGADPSLRWRTELGDRVTSIGWDGGPLVLAATWKGRLEALDAASGRRVWTAELGGRAEAPAVADGSAVFVATKARALLRIDRARGAVQWRATLPGMAIHPPAFLGERPRLVLCGTWDGQLLAYESVTGKLSWQTPVGAKLAGPPLVGTGLVAVVTADGAVRGYDPAGRPSWVAPGAAEGPATLIWRESPGAAARLLSVSRILVSLNASTGERLAGYPEGALEELRRRFADAMLEGVKTYSEAEKRAVQDREAFEISGPLFAPARLFGEQLAFGTEEGWAYLFDPATLRPRARYHAGPAAEGAPSLTLGRALAVAGEELYALDLGTGAVVWRRTLGGEPAAVTGDTTLGILAGGRLHAISATDGTLGWSLRGTFRRVAPAAREDAQEVGRRLWLVDDGEGNLRALVAPGRLVGDPLPLGGQSVALVATPTGSWWAASREGRLCELSWEAADAGATAAGEGAGRLVKVWEKEWGEPLADLQLAGGRLLVRSVAGSLVQLDPGTRLESWRVALARDDRVQAAPREGLLLVLAADGIDLRDWRTGELRRRQSLSAPALAAELQEGSLWWLDRLGRAHQATLAEGRTVTTDLGLGLSEALPVEGGFLVTTAAGEVGLVELVGAQPGVRVPPEPGVESRGVRR